MQHAMKLPSTMTVRTAAASLTKIDFALPSFPEASDPPFFGRSDPDDTGACGTHRLVPSLREERLRPFGRRQEEVCRGMQDCRATGGEENPRWETMPREVGEPMETETCGKEATPVIEEEDLRSEAPRLLQVWTRRVPQFGALLVVTSKFATETRRRQKSFPLQQQQKECS